MASKKMTPAKAAPRSAPPSTQQVAGIVPLAQRPALTGDVPWQTAHDNLEAALEAGNRLLDQLRDPAQRTVANNILDTLSDELTALNQEEIKDRTISLQAASGELGGGMAHLKALQLQLANISATTSEAQAVVTAIDKALTGLQSLLGTFAAL